MDVDKSQSPPETLAPKSPSMASLLMRVIDLEKEEIKDNLGFLIVSVHAVFLDSGFVLCNGDGSRLPKIWNSVFSIQYTVPELLARVHDAKVATLKFSVLRNHVVVYGYLSGEPDVYRLHFDLSKAVPLLEFLAEKEVFGFSKLVRDGLCLPLLMDVCNKNGLPLPLCFPRLPSDLKIMRVASLFTRAMDEEKEELKGDLGFLVVVVHAVFLDFGFVLCNGDGSRLPKNWNLATTGVSIRYTIPELLGRVHRVKDAKVATLKFSVLRNHVLVYGYLSGEPDVYRLHLDLSRVVPSLKFLCEKEVFEFLKLVKDTLCLHLLMDVCEKNGLPLPPCFPRLPTDLKIKVLEFLRGVDIARLGCSCSEMRRLALNDELWKQKFIQEFGQENERSPFATNDELWKQKVLGENERRAFALNDELWEPKFFEGPKLFGGPKLLGEKQRRAFTTNDELWKPNSFGGNERRAFTTNDELLKLMFIQKFGQENERRAFAASSWKSKYERRYVAKRRIRPLHLPSSFERFPKRIRSVWEGWRA